MVDNDKATPTRRKAALSVPSGIAIEVKLRVFVYPASGAVLIYNSILADDPARFDGPFLVGHIPADSSEIEFEMIEGAQQLRIETFGWTDDHTGEKHEERERLRAAGKPVVKPAIVGEKQRFYAAIGMGISQWQHIEGALANIFLFLTRAGDGPAANAGFFAAINFSTKLDMVDAAAKVRYRDNAALLAEWDDLYDEVHSKSKVRNNLAHFMSAISIRERDKYRYYLEESILDWNSVAKTNSPRYNFVNIENEARLFGGLALKLIGFLERISQTAPAPAP
jgi:hypothetical protein